MSELVKKLNQVGCPCGPINSIDQAFAEPQLKHLEMAKPVDHPVLGHISVVRNPINMPDYPNTLEIRQRAPELGEHNQEVLKQYGYSEEEIATLKQENVI